MDDDWNPMEDDFNDENFNSYNKGIGRDLPASRKSPATWGRNEISQEDGVKLYVAGIPNGLNQEGLKKMFSRAGKVIEAIKIPPKDDRPDTIGFVTMASTRDAECAIRKYDRFQIQSGLYVLKVSLALSKEEKRRRAEKRAEEEKFLKSLNGGKPSTEDELSESSPGLTATDEDPAPKKIPSIGRGIQMVKVLQNLPKPGSAASSPTGTRSPNSALEPSSVPSNQKRELKGGNQDNKPSTKDVSSGSPSTKAGKIKEVKPPSQPCNFCNTMGMRKCSRCKTPYCSPQCQRSDWDSHKLVCMTQEEARKKREEEEFSSRFDVEIGEDFVNNIVKQVSAHAERTGQKFEPPKICYEHTEDDVADDRWIQSSQREGKATEAKSSEQMTDKLISGDTEVLMASQIPRQILGDQERGFVIYIESTHKFYIQCPDMSEEFNDLVQGMVIYEDMPSQQYTPQVGEAVAAFCSEDGLWYRAAVLSVALNEINIKYLDFGNESSVSRTQVHPLIEDYVHLPAQAVPCSLVQSFARKTEEMLKNELNQKLVYLALRGKDEDGVYQVEDVLDSQSCTSLLEGVPTNSKTGQDGRSIIYQELPGHDSQVNVIWVESPGKFYIHCMENQARLVENLRKVNEYCKTNSKPYHPHFVGELVCAKLDIWYRGEVEEFLPNEMFRVNFIDFGNTAEIATSDIRAISSEFTELPRQGIPCCILDLNGTGHNGLWSYTDTKWFRECFDENRTFTVKPTRKKLGEINCVDLITENGELASELLVANKLAVRGKKSCAQDDLTGQHLSSDRSRTRMQEPSREYLELQSSEDAVTANVQLKQQVRDLQEQLRSLSFQIQQKI